MAVFLGIVANATPTVALEPGHSLPTAISQPKKKSLGLRSQVQTRYALRESGQLGYYHKLQ